MNYLTYEAVVCFALASGVTATVLAEKFKRERLIE